MTQKVAISGFDYDEIQDRLTRYLKGHDDWKEYDFTGGGMQMIIKLLAYHSTFEAMQQNITFNEVHLNTAQIYNNVCADVSILSYVPGSKTTSKILTNITVIPSVVGTAPANLTLTRYTKFVGVVDNKTFSFVPDQDYVIDLENGQYIFTDVLLIQGIRTISTFPYTGEGIGNFEIPNANIDISTLTVLVQESEFNTESSAYNRFINPYQLGSSEKIFYIEKNRFGFYNIEFGDNQISQKPLDGNIIICEYVVTEGDEANGVNSISLSETIDGYSNVSISMLSDLVAGGSDFEDINSIKFMAPKSFSTQGVAVTPDDYSSLVKQLYQNVSDVVSWGGETNTPPRVGYMFISIKPKTGEILLEVEKDYVVDLLAQHNLGSITPIVVDPNYYYLNIDANVRYDPSLTDLEQSVLKVKIVDFITKYSQDKLEKFTAQFIHSKLVEYINKIDKSVVGNHTVISYEQRHIPEINAINIFDVYFRHAIEPGTILVTGFQVANAEDIEPSFYMIDDLVGKLQLHMVTHDGIDTIVDTDVGDVDYITGEVNITNLIPTEIDDYVTIKADTNEDTQYDLDVFPLTSEIIKINYDTIDAKLTQTKKDNV